MKINLKRILVGVATSGLILTYSAVPAFASTTIEISGNGSSSDNTSTVTSTNTTTVVQTNDANVSNNITANASSGDNNASGNTGGNTSVSTGGATTDVSVANTVNSNSASIPSANSSDPSVTISGNGSNSENEANLSTANVAEAFQTNYADINNSVHANSSTGDNNANDNTNGNVSVTTGAADTTVGVTNTANSNVLAIAPGLGNGGALSLAITGNGTGSDNDISVLAEHSLTVVQDNDANIGNHIYAGSETGDNNASDNTNGGVMIHTGSADTTVGVANTANFNVADMAGEGALFGGTLAAMINGNGSNSENEIAAELGDVNFLTQTNNFSCGMGMGIEFLSFLNGLHGNNCSSIHAYSDSGDNNSSDNTGPGTFSVTTGGSMIDTMVTNTGNSNVIGSGSGIVIPFPGGDDEGMSLTLSFNLSQLLLGLGFGFV